MGGGGDYVHPYTKKGKGNVLPCHQAKKCKTMTVQLESVKISLSTPKLQTDHTCTCTLMCIVCIQYPSDARYNAFACGTRATRVRHACDTRATRVRFAWDTRAIWVRHACDTRTTRHAYARVYVLKCS